MEAGTSPRGKKLAKFVQPNFFFMFEGAMFSLQRRNHPKSIDTLKKGWPVGEWQGHSVHFFPSMRHGQPAVTAHAIAQAIWKELSTFGPTPPKSLYFSQRRLLSVTGKTWTGANRAAGIVALQQLADSYLEFTEPHPTDSGKTITTTVRFIQQLKLVVDEQEGNTHSLTITLSDFAHDSLTNKDVLLFNWDRLAELLQDPIAFNLAKNFVARGNKLMNRKTGQPTFSTKNGYGKDYRAVCDEYLGGLSHRTSKSLIKQQLQPAFDRVRKARFGAFYIKKSKTTKSGFVIYFKPLDGFYNDYEALLRAPKRRTPAHDKVYKDNEEKTAAVNLASYFHTKLGRDADYNLLIKEVEYIERLLPIYGFTQLELFIEYVAKICTRNKRIPDRVNVLASWEDAWNKDRAAADAKAEVKRSIATCRLCDDNGMVQLRREDGTVIAHRCPHNAFELMRIASEKGLLAPTQLDT